MREFKVVVLGSGGVGKSALTTRFVSGRFQEKFDPTIEEFYRKEIIVSGLPSMLEILDTAGAEQFASMQDLYIRNGQGFVIVYNIANLSSFRDVEAIRDRILQVKFGAASNGSLLKRPLPGRFYSYPPDYGKRTLASSTLHPHPNLPTILLVGNKADLGTSQLREVEWSMGDELAQKWQCPFLETSARTGEGVNEAFIEIVRRMAVTGIKKRRSCNLL